jgi:Peptidase family M1 domain
MKRLSWIVLLSFLAIANPASAQDATAVWNAVSQPAFDASKFAAVNGIQIARDRIHITLTSGNIQFAQPTSGEVFAAAFEGQGRVQIEPPNALEAQQLKRYIGKDTLDMQFSSATFSFADGTFAELSPQLHWTAPSGDDLGGLYLSRQHDREDVGDEIVPRLFQGVLSANHQRTAYFFADFKTADKGWVEVTFDALDPEAINVVRWIASPGYKSFDTWLHFPAGGRSSSEVFQDPMALADFDIEDYQIDATVAADTEFTATSRVHILQRAAGERILRFWLDSNLRVDSVKDESGASLLFFQAPAEKDRNNSYGEYVLVALPQVTEAGRSQTLEFHYAGKKAVRKIGSGNYFCESELWYPEGEGAFNVRSGFDMTFHSPKQYLFVATGTKVSETKDGDWLVTKWKNDKPLAVAGFAFGDYELFTDKAGDVSVEVYANRNPSDVMAALQNESIAPVDGASESLSMPLGSFSPSAMGKHIGEEVANALRVFQNYYGPDPYTRIAVTDIPGTYGMGWPMLLYLSSASFLDSSQMNALDIKDQVEFTDYFRGLMVSHQWWGHRVGWKSYHDEWLSAGFATFSGNLYVQYREDWKEYQAHLQTNRDELFANDIHGHTFESDGPIWMGNRLASSEAPHAYDVVVHNKGGYVLNMLRMMLYDPHAQDPDARFKAMMQDFCQTFDNKAASTEDFKAIAEKHMTPQMDLDGNQRLDWFFNQYVYGTEIAQYKLAYSVQNGGPGKWNVSGTVTRTAGPDGWKDVLPIYIHTGGKTLRLGWIGIGAKGETPFAVTLPMQPDGLSLNDNHDILADVK